MKLKTLFLISCVVLSNKMYSQYVIKNYTNANIEQLANMKQIADWIQFNNAENVIQLLSNTTYIDVDFLRIESIFLSKEYPRDEISSTKNTTISDDRNIVWLERNIYKASKKKLKARYQIYFTVEYINDSYQIIDLTFGKKKKINTTKYDKN